MFPESKKVELEDCPVVHRTDKDVSVFQSAESRASESMQVTKEGYIG